MNTVLELNEKEKLVYDVIHAANGKITQRDIAKKLPQLGSHEKHENYVVTDTTLRKVRQIIRDMRINKGVFILSDVHGYWILRDRKEIDEYLSRIERTARATAKACMVTYNAMRKNFGVSSAYFEQLSIFQKDNKND